MTAPTQQQIKDVAALKRKKSREEAGLILVEGRHPIEEAHKAGLRLRHYFVQTQAVLDNLPAVTPPLAPLMVNEAMMQRMASTDSAPPCLAVFEAPLAPSSLPGSFCLVLDSVQDPGNLGTLVRSALAFGAEAIVLAGDCVEPYSPKVIRASAGLVFAIPVLEKSAAEMAGLFDGDWTIYTTTGDASACSYRAADYTGRCVLVLGNEGRGVSTNLFPGRAVNLLTIPMSPQVESLNVAVSGSIILAEAAVRRAASGNTAQPVGGV